MDIYISYRRIDSMDIAGRIYDRLANEFGAEAVFRDFESMGLAEDFGERMAQETTRCKVLVVVIGLQWLAATDPQGNRKLDNPADWIHREIAAFLARPNAQIFPVLVHGALMPRESDLPKDLADLTDRYAIDIRGGREFRQGMTDLVTGISTFVPLKTGITSRGRKVFIVHGHDRLLLSEASRFVEHQNLPLAVLLEQPNLGRTVIEKFEQESKDVGYTIVLLTPDDVGNAARQSSNLQERARQNVIFELGYFISQLGRGKVCLLHKGNIEILSDLHGILYVEADDAGAWRFQLAKEMKAAGLPVDLNNVV